jgi:hypothetical protein
MLKITMTKTRRIRWEGHAGRKGEMKMRTRSWLKILKAGDRLEDLSVDHIKNIYQTNWMTRYEPDLSDSEQEPVVGYCEYAN